MMDIKRLLEVQRTKAKELRSARDKLKDLKQKLARYKKEVRLLERFLSKAARHMTEGEQRTYAEGFSKLMARLKTHRSLLGNLDSAVARAGRNVFESDIAFTKARSAVSGVRTRQRYERERSLRTVRDRRKRMERVRTGAKALGIVRPSGAWRTVRPR